MAEVIAFPGLRSGTVAGQETVEAHGLNIRAVAMNIEAVLIQLKTLPVKADSELRVNLVSSLESVLHRLRRGLTGIDLSAAELSEISRDLRSLLPLIPCLKDDLRLDSQAPTY